MAKGYLVVCYREVSDPAKLETYAELAPKAMLPRSATLRSNRQERAEIRSRRADEQMA